jgi:hypothetical protein
MYIFKNFTDPADVAVPDSVSSTQNTDSTE